MLGASVALITAGGITASPSKWPPFICAMSQCESSVTDVTMLPAGPTPACSLYSGIGTSSCESRFSVTGSTWSGVRSISSMSNIELDIRSGPKNRSRTICSHVLPVASWRTYPDPAYIRLLYRKVVRSGCAGSRYWSRSNSSARVNDDLYQIRSCRVIPVRCESMSRSVTVLFSSSL